MDLVQIPLSPSALFSSNQITCISLLMIFISKCRGAACDLCLIRDGNLEMAGFEWTELSRLVWLDAIVFNDVHVFILMELLRFMGI